MVDSNFLLDQAMHLPPDQRENLAIQLLMSVNLAPRKALDREEFQTLLNDRIQEIERGEEETVDAFEALRAARERIARRSA